MRLPPPANSAETDFLEFNTIFLSTVASTHYFIILLYHFNWHLHLHNYSTQQETQATHTEGIYR